MIADTTFLIHFLQEGRAGVHGPARRFFARHRKGDLVRTSMINLGEIAVSFPTSAAAWEYFQKFTIYRLAPGVVNAAADVDRELIRTGARLGENDNWVAGFARYYREPIISLDAAFDRVQDLRRIRY
ncbi:MAG: twitching motility protein PilT [Pedosphaera sp.]|nr:twitching motility protein PilT [Pedosphaera sp.]